ncbi:ABC transporter [Ureibacillus massiliensis 4400831 = CIP 108448 = CCUG 49529]|uniref:Transport permease protein n=1 Tax=Ureibacillus massiliensis 4400831 = CIP 108448 = CCUG 49529 TaxID=1211035 RepID=A0A0A3JSR1_9BACL|nr:ABC transporter permease [Ureibacillus massiliensis]KGR90047.1 ABC transporter [Ureibacillus massiliensis 4400831 = CIP 108448 = CCUG 49529]
MITALWNYKNFIIGLVKKDFKTKYLNSVLGSLWTIIHPLTFIIIYTVIFANVMSAKLPGINDVFAYSIYLCAGLLTWNFFAETCQRMVSVFLDNRNILTKVNFPKITLPVYIVVTTTMNFLIIFCIFLLFLIISNQFPYETILYIIPLLIVQIILSASFGFILGILNVFFRDIGHFLSLGLQFWFWLTPIVYVKDILPDWTYSILNYNIMFPIINGYQNILLYNKIPDFNSILVVFIISVILMLIGFYIYKKLLSEMVDEL